MGWRSRLRGATIYPMTDPVGFLITWTCYGTWFTSDERGSVDREHNAYQTPLVFASKRRVAGLRSQMTHPAFRLTKSARELVATTIEEHCRVRGWQLLAVNARSNHVHVVVAFARVGPEKMMGQWKAWSSRRLRALGLAKRGQPVWTRHGSTRYLWNERDIEPAVAYVVEGQNVVRFGESSR